MTKREIANAPLRTEFERVHVRAMECRSFRRADGLWDVEGRLTDVKPFLNDFRGEVKPGEPLHDMWLRLTLDGDFVVRAVEAVTDAGPYALCPAILPSFRKLEGMKIGPGWNRRVRETLGGALGCTHLAAAADRHRGLPHLALVPRPPTAAARRRRNRRSTRATSGLRTASRSGPPTPNTGREGASRLRPAPGRP